MHQLNEQDEGSDWVVRCRMWVSVRGNPFFGSSQSLLKDQVLIFLYILSLILRNEECQIHSSFRCLHLGSRGERKSIAILSPRSGSEDNPKPKPRPLTFQSSTIHHIHKHRDAALHKHHHARTPVCWGQDACHRPQHQALRPRCSYDSSRQNSIVTPSPRLPSTRIVTDARQHTLHPPAHGRSSLLPPHSPSTLSHLRFHRTHPLQPWRDLRR